MGANLILPAGSAAASGGGDSTPAEDPVVRSLRFNRSGSSYLSRTLSSSETSWTVSLWVKRGILSSSIYQHIFNLNGNSQCLSFYAGDKLAWYDGSSTYTTSRLFRDCSAWTHLAVLNNAGTITLYVNGVQETSGGFSSTISSGTAAGVVSIGRFYNSGHGTHYLDGYLSDFYFIEGSAVNPVDNFIESNNYGGYKPKAYTGSFGTNGFHIDAQVAHGADLLVSSIDRNDGDTLFADAAKGHTITRSGAVHKDTVGNPFDSSGTAMYFDGSNDWVQVSTASTDFQFGTGDFTIEGWFYFSHLNSAQVICDLRPSNVSDSTRPSFNTTGSNINMHFNGGNTTVGTGGLTTSQWQHIAIVRASGSLKVYVDGVLKGTTSFTSDLSAAATPHIGATNTPNQEAFLSGYVYDFRITKGTALYTSSFTVPSATFELNPVYIGGDQSGNKNHFTPTNISGHDVMLDVPYPKNYATWNPLTESGATYSEGNTKISCNFDSANGRRATVEVSSGKWYWEVLRLDAYGNVGVFDCSNNTVTYFAGYSSSDYGMSMMTLGFYRNGSQTSTSNTTGSGDIVQFALDVDAGKLWIGKNGTWFESGDPSAGTNAIYSSNISGRTWSPSVGQNYSYTSNFVLNAGADPTFANNKTSGQDTSQSEFYYAPPTGFKSLNTSNLDDPAVTPSEHFGVATWSGNSSSQEISDYSFEPDFVWIKNRNYTYTHGLFDSVRGGSKVLQSSATSSEVSSSSYLTSFDDDGFTMGNNPITNSSSYTYVGWCWKESASAGFDIVTYEGDSDSTGDSQNISHSLGVAPEMIIVKARDGRAYNDYYHQDNWYVWHKDLSSDSLLFLNSTSSETDYSSGSGYAPINTVGSSTFTVSNEEDPNYNYDLLNWGDPYNYYTGDNERYVAYLFSGVEGHSRFGFYTGNGSADGPVVYTGFRPSFLMIKRVSNSDGWVMHDNARDPDNSVQLILQADSTASELGSGTDSVDFLATGFKLRVASTARNNSGEKYIYACFAESPLKYSNAK